MDVRKVGLGVAGGGAVLQVVGFLIDGRLHAADPELASREGVLTLSNAGHLGVFLGLAAVFVGIAAAFVGPQLYRPTLPHQIGRRLAQLSAPVAAMALIGGLGVGANASSLGAVHTHDHRTSVAAGEAHVPGDHDHTDATGDHASMDHANEAMDHGHDDDSMDHDNGAMDHGNDNGSSESAGGDHAHSSSSSHGAGAHTDTVSFGQGHSDGDDHGHTAGVGDDHAHDTTDTTAGGHHHGDDTTIPGQTTTTHPDHDHGTDTTIPGETTTTHPDHDHGSTTTVPGETTTTHPDHDHGSTTTLPDHTTTTHGDHDHVGTTLPGENCKNGSHDHGHVGPIELDATTQALQDEQLAQAKAFAEQYPTAASAVNAGYSQVTHYLCGIGAHYMKFSWVDETFNASEPEILLYDGDGPFAKLVGINYYVGSSSGIAPDGFAGPNDQWHQHIGLCLKGFFVIGPEEWTAEQCEAAGGVKQSDGGYYWLLHAWVVTGYEMPADWFSPVNPVLPPGPWDNPDSPVV